MKRFLRYALYREGYRFLREAKEDLKDAKEDVTANPEGRATDTNGTSSSRSSTAPADPTTSERSDKPAPATTDESPLPTEHATKTLLQQVDPYDFEQLVADLWAEMGWETEVSQSSNDKGIDIIAKKSDPYTQTALIQAKRYGPETTVGSPEVQQYNSLKQQRDGADKVIIVTSNDFSSQAETLADKLNVKLVNGDTLADLLEQYAHTALLRNYLDLPDENNAAPTDSDTEITKRTVSTTVVNDESTANEATDTHSSGRENSITLSDKSRSTDQQTESRKETTASLFDRNPGGVDKDEIRSAFFDHSNRWHKAITAGVLGWGLVLFGAEVLPLGVWGLLFFGSWLGLPIALYKDAQLIADEFDWPAHPWAYVLSAIVWFFAILPGVLYLYRRHKTVSETALDTDRATAAPTEPTPALDQESTSDTEPTGDKSPVHVRTDGASENGSPAATYHGTREPAEAERGEITYHGERYYCAFETASNGRWTVAYALNYPDDPRYFVYDGVDLVTTARCSKVHQAKITNDGVIALITGEDARELLVEMYADESGDELQYIFASEAELWDLTESAKYLAVITAGPNPGAYIFDLGATELTTTHHPSYDEIQSITFTDDETDPWLYIRPENAVEAYAVNLENEIVWEADEDEAGQTDRTSGAPVATATSGSAAAPKDVVREYFEEVINGRNYGKLDDYLADEFVGHETGIKDHGYDDLDKADAKAGVKELETAFPDYNYVIKDLVADGDTVAVRWQFEGTHKGKFGDVPATNRSVSYAGMNFVRVSDGQIVEDWEVSDVVALFSQLGLAH